MGKKSQHLVEMLAFRWIRRLFFGLIFRHVTIFIFLAATTPAFGISSPMHQHLGIRSLGAIEKSNFEHS